MNITRPLVVLDIETTGLNPEVDRIVEIAMIRLVPGKEAEHWCVRCNPGVPISPEATAVHGIKDEDVSCIETFEQISLYVRDFLENADL
jgi:DNA polymerase-3 subunit epsilon